MDPRLSLKNDCWKSDMFSFGVVMLDVATLGHYPQLYDWNNGNLNRQAFQEAFSMLSKRYSKKFINLLKEMLKFDPCDRILLKTLMKRLSYSLKDEIQDISRYHTTLLNSMSQCDSDDEDNFRFLKEDMAHVNNSLNIQRENEQIMSQRKVVKCQPILIEDQ